LKVVLTECKKEKLIFLGDIPKRAAPV